MHWTHDSGGYFEHELEDADECRLTYCAYQSMPGINRYPLLTWP
ncbi:hypothetical protein [Citrobacter freundii]